MGRLDRRLSPRHALRLYLAVTVLASAPLIGWGLLVDGVL